MTSRQEESEGEREEENPFDSIWFNLLSSSLCISSLSPSLFYSAPVAFQAEEPILLCVRNQFPLTRLASSHFVLFLFLFPSLFVAIRSPRPRHLRLCCLPDDGESQRAALNAASPQSDHGNIKKVCSFLRCVASYRSSVQHGSPSFLVDLAVFELGGGSIKRQTSVEGTLMFVSSFLYSDTSKIPTYSWFIVSCVCNKD